MKLKDDEYWAVIDRRNTYMTTLHETRAEARKSADEGANLIDGKFVVRKVRIVEIQEKP